MPSATAKPQPRSHAATQPRSHAATQPHTHTHTPTHPHTHTPTPTRPSHPHTRRRQLQGPSEHDVPVPPLLKTALVWGLFMGVSSNLRYQAVFGLERAVDVTIAKKVPQVGGQGRGRRQGQGVRQCLPGPRGLAMRGCSWSRSRPLPPTARRRARARPPADCLRHHRGHPLRQQRHRRRELHRHGALGGRAVRVAARPARQAAAARPAAPRSPAAPGSCQPRACGAAACCAPGAAAWEGSARGAHRACRFPRCRERSRTRRHPARQRAGGVPS
jgi:hypothetical protein